MAVYHVVGPLLCVLALSNIGLSTCRDDTGSGICVACPVLSNHRDDLKGSVVFGPCPLCNHRDDLKGIKILVKCDKVKRMVVATTREDGSFETELPSDIRASSSSPSQKNCQAMILGGPKQLYASTKTAFSTIISTADNSYTLSRPLTFYTSCPPGAKCEATGSSLGSSKTINPPFRKELGLAPSGYYVPFVPIIKIP